tara:strand:+ start:2936 stop:3109 length:174 start_codon:yes stop_codon:yes gene_type:complete
MPGTYKMKTYGYGGGTKNGKTLPVGKNGGQQSLLTKLTTRAPKPRKTSKGCGCGGER